MENQVMIPDDVKQALSVAGWDAEKELSEMAVETSQLELPRIRIEHKDNGKHRLYIDRGESYLDDGFQEIYLKGNKLTGVVFAEAFVRALWQEGEEVPICSALDNKPVGKEPLSDNCKHCEHGVIGGSCKPKIRLLMLVELDGEVKPLIMNLSPTSIAKWQAHKRKLSRSNLPVVAVNTTFELEDQQRKGFRWATVKLGMAGIASKEMLMLAKTAREELEALVDQISHRDFEDAGDKF